MQLSPVYVSDKLLQVLTGHIVAAQVQAFKSVGPAGTDHTPQPWGTHASFPQPNGLYRWPICQHGTL